MMPLLKTAVWKRWLLLMLVAFAAYPVQAKQKNVLFIAVDDLKPLLNCYGHEHVHSPNIDALAASGMVFQNAHCQQALCGPSRMSLLTGYYPDTLGIYGMGPERYRFRPRFPDLVTLPQHFKNNGYVTIGTGKIFDPRNLDGDWNGPQDAASWTHFFGRNPYNANIGGPIISGRYHNPAFKDLVAELKKKGSALGLTDKKLQQYVRDHGGGPAVECYDVPDDSYQDGAIANRGIEQLETLKNSNKPFLLAIGFVKPHLPFVAPKKYWDLYDRETLELAAHQRYPQDSPKCAETKYVEARTYSGVPTTGPISPATQRELIHGYLACVSYVDAQIGRLIAKLKETGMQEDTIILLWGDHGFHLGDKQLWGKHTNYEQSTRTPLIIASPDLPGAGINRSPVNLIDIFPTLCELTDLEPPTGTEGKSLAPILQHSRDSVNEFAATIFPHDKHWGVAIRTERYRYIAWYKGVMSKKRSGARLKQKPQFTELYDYHSDPLEQTNLSGNPSYKEIEEKLAKMNRAHVAATQNRQFSN
ncbi:sulfatase [Rhodopirellula europaea]|uniref:sulfatase n=1 Tax=Rhodopirellula europaea TaxID=1263866 RepID=UPI003D277100|tara:strand:+ start:5182 stop:6771 length:1590 start_codon:yes stop_codon:yes gene_type:complete